MSPVTCKAYVISVLTCTLIIAQEDKQQLRHQRAWAEGAYYDQQTSYYLLASLLPYLGRWHFTSQLSFIIKEKKGTSPLHCKLIYTT
jgi:hypothetical protein